ncbi:MAG: helical backbone metal receptor [Ignavibacteriales bacterium]|nr:helical backbone metal receptor [Ignavibacteriales bacterium]
MKKLARLKIILIYFLFFICTGITAQKQLKIVSLAPNWTNITAAIGATDNLVGVTRYCIFPDSIPRLVKEGKLQIVAGFMDVDFQKVKDLNPDIILTCTGVQAKIRDRFLKDGYKVIHMDESSLEEVYSKILEFGKSIDKELSASNLVNDIKSNLQIVANKYKNYPKVSVYYEINYYYKCAPGKDSYITELIRMVGGEPIFSDRAGIAPSVKWEEVVKANPDVILIPIWDKAGGPYFEGEKVGYGTTTPFEISARVEAQNVNAVKSGKVRYINSAKTKQAGPQIPIAAELFGKTIHAEGDVELLKIDKVPENMETTFSKLFFFLPFVINEEHVAYVRKAQMK